MSAVKPSIFNKLPDRDFKPIKFIVKLIAVAFVAFLMALGLRGYIAYHEGVFFQKTMREKVPLEARIKLGQFEEDLVTKRMILNKIDSSINASLQAGIDTDKLKNLFEAKANITASIMNAQPPIKLEAFYMGDAMLLWPWLYTCLGWLIFILRPSGIRTKFYIGNIFKIILVGAMLFLFYRWPTYVRNFLTGSEGQKVFGAANYNISKTYFYVQEIIIFIFMNLISIIWSQWTWYFNKVRLQTKQYLFHPTEYEKNFANVTYIASISKSFIRWQVNSLILAIGFLYYSNVFWQYVIDSGDSRYIISAFIVHFIWGLTWMLISLPLLYQWFNWHLIKLKILTEIYQDRELSSTEKKEKIQIIESIKPITSWNIAGSSIAGLIAFLLPIINGLIR